MKKMIWAIVALLGLAAWADKDLALECPGVTFTTSDEWAPPWTVEEGAGATGGLALRGPEENMIITNDWDGSVEAQGGWLTARMEGAGTFSYKYKVTSAPKSWEWSFYMEKDGSYDGSYSYSLGRWQDQSVVFYEAGEHDLSWYFRNDEQNGGCSVLLSDFVWTRAPETMTVAFDANGGTLANADPHEYAPGDTYGELPVPTRQGWTFLGWHIGSLDGAKVSATDKVAFEENITLVAQWGQALTATILNSKKFTNFKLAGADKWYKVDVPDLGTVAEVEPKGKVDGDWIRPTVSSLQVTSTTAGYLAFRWSLTNGGRTASGNGDWSYAGITLYIDGKEVESEDVWSFGQATGVKQLYVYVPAGKHTLKWEVKGRRAYYYKSEWNNETEEYEYTDEWGSAPVVRLWGFEFEPAAPQADLQTWGDKVKKYKSWRTGDLARFAAQFKTRMIADPEDYEARVLFAATRLGVLAENKQFTDYAKTFGFTVDWARMSVTPPKPKFDKKSAAVNAMVDKTIALATPAINEAKAALDGIPEDWAGKVTLSADEWPLDETTVIDLADVLFARAGLDAALAGLNFLGAYDLTANWPKVSDTTKLVTKIPAVKTLPKIGDAAGWEKSARCFRAIAATKDEINAAEDGEGELSANATGALAVNGAKLALRLAYPYADGWLNDTNQVRDIDFTVRAGATKLNVYAKVYGENGVWEKPWKGCSFCGPEGPGSMYYKNASAYHTKTNVACTVTDWKTETEWKAPATITIRGNELVLTVDMAKVNLGTKKKPVGFAKKSWTVDKGEVGIGSWYQTANPNWFEPYEDEWGDWIEPDDDEPPYIDQWAEQGLVEWSAQSDSERKLLKFVNDQKGMFSKVRDAARLGASRRQFKAALERALAADAKATARPEGGDMHFFEYAPEDKAAIGFARANTQRALATLDAPAAVDFAAVADEYDAAGISTKLKLADFKYTLLPDGGMTRIYLGALFEGKITRDLMPPMRVNAYGEIVPDFDAMPDPTIGGLIPDMTREHIADLSGRFEEARELDHGDWLEPEYKPGEKVAIDFADYKGSTASGLPKGWTWNKKTGVLTGTAASTFTVTFTSGKNKFSETVQVGAKPAVLLFSDDEAAVAVTGTGLYNVGATVKAVAAVRNGFAFGGWYGEDGEFVSPLAVYSFKMAREDVSLIATTIPLENDKLQVLEPDDPTKVLSTGEEAKFSLYCESVSPFTVSAAGLPPGLVVSNDFAVMGGSIVGFTVVKGTPTKAGVYYTTFVAKNNGGFKRTVVIRFVVDDAEESVVNTANIDLGLLDMQQLTAGSMLSMATEVPPDAKGSVAKSVKAKGVPDGMKATLANGELRFGGTPTTAGKYTLDLTVTYANKKTARTTKTIIVHDNGSLGGVYIPTGVLDNDPDGAVRGTAAYVGVKQYGQTVKFTATTKDKKKWFFGGWFLDEDCSRIATNALPGVDWQSATVSAQIGDAWLGSEGRKGMYARFVTKAEEAEDGVAIVCDDFWRVKDKETGLSTNLAIAVFSDTKATLTASGLPAGTKLSDMKLIVAKEASLVPGEYAVTLTLKTAAGNVAKKKVTVFVPNVTTAVDMGLLELNTSDEGYSTNTYDSVMCAGVKKTFSLEDLDVYASDGWTLSVTGLPKGWTYNAKTKKISGVATKVGKTTVTFTVSKKVGKKVTSYKATATFDLAPLPTWATGTFVGTAYLRYFDGYVAAGSAMSGTERGAGQQVRAPGPVDLIKAYFKMTVTPGGAISGYFLDERGKRTFTATGYDSDEFSATLKFKYQGKVISKTVYVDYNENLDVEQGTISFDEDGAAFGILWGIEGAKPLPVFAAGASFAFPAGNGTLALKFGENGVVACTYNVGKNATSGSGQICNLEWDPDAKEWGAEVAVAIAAKKDKKGKVLVPAIYDSFRLYLPADNEGNVITANITAE